MLLGVFHRVLQPVFFGVSPHDMFAAGRINLIALDDPMVGSFHMKA
jgi:hypothetical protein